MARCHWYPDDSRPSLEVRVDGQWWPAELRSSSWQAGEVTFHVAWFRDGQSLLGTFSQHFVRLARG